jgi:hypothetical protein
MPPSALLLVLLLAEHVVYVVALVCALIAYGGIIYGVIQDLAGRPVSIAEAVAIAARRSLDATIFVTRSERHIELAVFGRWRVSLL